MTKPLLAAALAAAVAVGAWALFLRSTDDGHPIWVGALEDAVKQPDPATAEVRVALASKAGFNATWPSRSKRFARNVAAAARRHRVRIFLSVFAERPRDVPLTEEEARQFVAFTAALARDLPTVRDFVVWNEPNLNGFWQPQFNELGKDIAAPTYVGLLARTYDGLKGVSARIRVLGGALAPRGADNPNAPRHTQSPTAFIREMGLAYRASGRTKPIMDVFAIHPYLERSAIPPTQRHPLGTSIGIADYEKLVRLLGEAFDGTAQPGSKLPIAYTEFGIQSKIPPSVEAPYTNLQSPIGLDAVDEKTQAEIKRQESIRASGRRSTARRHPER